MFIQVKYITTILLSCIFISTLAQSKLSTNKKKAAELYYQADNYMVKGQYTLAFDLLKQATDKDDEFYEAFFRMGIIDKARGNVDTAEEYLLKTLELNPGNAGANFELGELYIQIGKYEKSKIYTQAYLDLNPRNSKRKSEAKRFLENADYAIENIKRGLEINPRPLNETVNQFAMQYFPVVTADQQYLIYTRRFGTTLNHDEDLVISKKEDGDWGDPVSISQNINSEVNEGTCTISADGRTLIFTSCYGRRGFGSCDLFITYKIGTQWTEPINLGANVNSSSWDSQPSLSADGRTLFFISNRNGGIGKRDIWMTTLNDNDIWSKPENLGPTINTVEDEVSPFIHPNNQTLYFASNGRKGFGGFDIYYSQKEADNWNTPKNLGYPINTGDDQVSLFITADGKKGYYSHENLGNSNVKGLLYEFDFPEELQLEKKATYVKGKVFDKSTNQPLKAKLELYDVEEDERISMVSSDSVSGEYLTVLPEGTKYAFYVNKEGYLFKSIFFDHKKDNKPLELDIPLERITVGITTTLENVFFDFDKYELKPESKTELNKVVQFLKSNSNLRIEIGGFTDNQGAAAYNMDLSVNRAKSVYDYLIQNGIEPSQISYKGYGQSQPVASNENEAGRAKNRRIEFRVIK